MFNTSLSTNVIAAAIPTGPGAPAPTKRAIQALMQATSKYIAMSEWVADQEVADAGPIEAKAFLDGVIGMMGVKTTEAGAVKGEKHKAAGERLSTTEMAQC